MNGKVTRCSFNGCDNEGQASKNGKKYLIKGFCVKHYTRLKVHGDPAYTTIIVDGKSKHPQYPAYRAMIARCNNKNTNNYKDYGGRGIKVCERWSGMYGFTNFIKDMGNRPTKEYSLDRIDTNKDYSPDNCRWANRYIQATNKRNIRGKGYWYEKSRNRFVAYILVKGKRISSYHVTEEEAINKRKQYEATYYY